MLGLFKKKDPVADLKKDYARLTQKALELQRAGNMPEFARVTAEAEVVGQRIDELQSKQN